MSDAVLYPARAVRIHSPRLVEASLDLGWGASMNRVFRLDSVSIDGLDADTRARATKCLVILIGGKRLIVQVECDDPNRHPVDARIYLEEPTHGTLVGHTIGLSDAVNPVLEVAPFMEWLAERDFNVVDVLTAVNGPRRRERSG